MKRGFTLIETLIFAGLLTLFLTGAGLVARQAMRAMRQSTEHAGAVRSALLAVETIHADAERMLYQCPSRDLAIHRDGQGVSLRVPVDSGAPDLWSGAFTPVSYALVRCPGTPAYRLERGAGDPAHAAPVGGCVLRDLKIALVDGGTPENPRAGCLTITASGVDEPSSAHVETLSVLVPLPVQVPGGGYLLGPGES